MTDGTPLASAEHGLVATRLTAGGRGAIAVIAVEGRPETLALGFDALFRAANGRRFDEQLLGRIVFGTWGTVAGEDVVLCRVAPDRCEIHCHGGDAAVRRILSDVSADALPPPTLGLWQELHTALSLAPTWLCADLLNDQLQTHWPKALEEWNAGLADQRVPSDFLLQLRRTLVWERFGRHLTTPWSVVLTGRPNVGKSSLINALLGYQRAIVADEPGTTRDVVTATTAFQGWPVTLSDTAGQRATDNPLEAAGVALARQSLATADAVILILDGSQPLTSTDRDLLSRFPEALVVAHKSDLSACWDVHGVPAAMPVSSRTRDGLETLWAAVMTRLIPELPPSGIAIPVTDRQTRLLKELWKVANDGDVATARRLLAELEAGHAVA